MFVSGMFGTEAHVTVDVQEKTVTYTNGQSETTYASKFTAEALFWKGAMRESNINDQIREQTDATVVYDYDSTKVPVNTDRVVINSKTYEVIGVDNIAEQNEVMMVMLKWLK